MLRPRISAPFLALAVVAATGGGGLSRARAAEPCVGQTSASVKESPSQSSPAAGYTCWGDEGTAGDQVDQESLARMAFARLWERAAPLLAAGADQIPRLRFVPYDAPKPAAGAVMWVGPDEAGQRTIFITPGQRRLLAKRSGNWRSHYAGLTRALHETAHYFQSDAVLADVVVREQGANSWAKAHAPAVLGTRKKGRAVAADAWRDVDQFGSNYGGDPTTFRWPGGVSG